MGKSDERRHLELKRLAAQISDLVEEDKIQEAEDLLAEPFEMESVKANITIVFREQTDFEVFIPQPGDFVNATPTTDRFTIGFVCNNVNVDLQLDRSGAEALIEAHEEGLAGTTAV